MNMAQRVTISEMPQAERQEPKPSVFEEEEELDDPELVALTKSLNAVQFSMFFMYGFILSLIHI